MSQYIILNNHGPSSVVAHSDTELAKKIAADLRTKLFSIFGKHLDEKDGSINYIALAKDPEFRDFVLKTTDLAVCNAEHLSQDERKAFFINIYNVLTIHALADAHSKLSEGENIKSTCEIPDFWNTFAYKVGGHVLTLDVIEHSILRGNRAHPMTHKKILEENDPRLKLSLTTVDPRIHFALNCGAMSCPMARVYTVDVLDKKLDSATSAYLQSEIKMDQSGGRTIVLPQTLEWYAVDFGGDIKSVLRWTLKYLESEKIKQLEELIALENFQDVVKIEYFYDWNVNHKEVIGHTG